MSKKFICLVLFSLLSCFSFAQPRISSSAELAAAFKEGGSYLLAAGRYEFTESLFIERDLQLIGEGMNETLIVSSAPLVAIKTEEAIKVHFEGIHFETTHKDGADVMDIKDAELSIVACRFKGASYAEIDDLFYGSGLYLYGTVNAHISDSLFEANEMDGIHLEHNAKLELFDSYFFNNDGALSLFDSTKAKVINTDFGANGVEGGAALYTDFSSSLELLDSRVHDNGGGLSFFGDSVISIVGTTIEANKGYVAVEERAYLTLEASLIRQNTAGGVWFFGESRGELFANDLSFNGDFASLGVADDAFVMASENDFSHATDTAVYAYGNARAELQLNRFKLNATALVLAESARLLFHENQLIDGTDAIRLQDDSFLSAKANDFINISMFGVELFESSHAFLSDNIFIGGYAETVIALYNDASATLHNNDINYKEVNFGAIFATNDANAQVFENTIRNNSIGGAISLYENATALIQDNSLNNNDLGVFLIDQATARLRNNDLDANNIAILLSNTSFASLYQNRISNSKEIGVRLYDNSVAWLDGNSIMGSASNGLQFSEESNASLFNNEITHNGRDGLVITNQARAYTYKNLVTNNARAGFVATDDSVIRVEANRLSQNTLAGLAFDLSSGGRAISNVIDNNRYGVFIAPEAHPALSNNQFGDNEIDTYSMEESSE